MSLLKPLYPLESENRNRSSFILTDTERRHSLDLSSSEHVSVDGRRRIISGSLHVLEYRDASMEPGHATLDGHGIRGIHASWVYRESATLGGWYFDRTSHILHDYDRNSRYVHDETNELNCSPRPRLAAALLTCKSLANVDKLLDATR